MLYFVLHFRYRKDYPLTLDYLTNIVIGTAPNGQELQSSWWISADLICEDVILSPLQERPYLYFAYIEI